MSASNPTPADQPSSAGPAEQPSSAGPAEQPSSAGPAEQPSSAGPAEQPSSAGPAEQPSSAGPAEQPSSAGPAELAASAGAAEHTRMDVRLLLPAATGWLAAVVLLALPWWVGFVTGAVSGIAAVVVWRWRSGESGRSAADGATGADGRDRLSSGGRLRGGGGVAGGRSGGGWRVTVLGVVVVVAAMGVVCGMQVRSMRAGPVPELAAAEAAVSVTLVVTGDPVVKDSPGSRRPPYVVLRARVERITGRGRTTEVRTPVLVVGAEAWSGVRFGARLDANGRLREVDAGSDVAAVLTTRTKPREVDGPGWWLRAAERVRAGLRESVQDQPEAVRGLVPALVMGDESGLPEELNEDFRATGLTHLAAVSGTNLTLLLAFVVPLARIGGVRARGLTAVGLLTVVVFVVLARPQPSVLRAAAMGLVALAAMTSGGAGRGVRSLSAAVLGLLLLDVSLARSAGFALSVLATAGIVILAPGWRDVLARRMPRWLAEAMACPLAAQLACTPVVAWLSGQVSLVAVAANLLAGPAVGPATVLGFAAAGTALLSHWLAGLVGWCAAWPARWIVAVAEHGADLPGAVSGWPATVAGITVLTVLCLVAVAGMQRLLNRPVAAVVALVVLTVAVVRPVGRIGWPPPDWVLVACDVGQGDGLVLRAGPGAAVVVDTGPDPVPMDRCLRELGVRYVPVLVITHFHADHAGGLAGVLSGRTVGEIDVTAYPSPPAEQRRVLALAAVHRVGVRVVQYGERRTVGPVGWTVLWPARVPSAPGIGKPSASTEGSPENNTSVTMMVETAGIRMLLTGDLEPESQRAVLATGADLRADILKVPHHGSSRQDEAFLRATGARIAVVSAGIDNDYGHPAPSTLDLLLRLGMTVARTDTGGSVAVVRTTDGLALATSGPSTCTRCRP